VTHIESQGDTLNSEILFENLQYSHQQSKCSLLRDSHNSEKWLEAVFERKDQTPDDLPVAGHRVSNSMNRHRSNLLVLIIQIICMNLKRQNVTKSHPRSLSVGTLLGWAAYLPVGHGRISGQFDETLKNRRALLLYQSQDLSAAECSFGPSTQTSPKGDSFQRKPPNGT
jgi:hypothetical protein